MKSAAEFAGIWGDDIFKMAGTEGTNKFIVVLVTDLGRVGFRDYTGNGSYRIRVEPSCNEALEILNRKFPHAFAGLPKPDAPRRLAWKRPGDQGQNRFSTEAHSDEELKRALITAFSAVLNNNSECAVSRKPECPEWAKKLVEVCGGTPGQPESESAKRTRMIKCLRLWKVPGSNGAIRWKTATIEEKYNEALLRLAMDHILNSEV